MIVGRFRHAPGDRFTLSILGRRIAIGERNALVVGRIVGTTGSVAPIDLPAANADLCRSVQQVFRRNRH